MRMKFQLNFLIVAAFLVSGTLGLEAAEGTLLDTAVDEVVRRDRAIERAWRAVKSEADLVARRDQLREAMSRAIGAFPERCDLDARVLGTVERKDYRVEKVLFASRPNHHVTAHLFLPSKGKKPHPAILMPCGHDVVGKLSQNHQRAAVRAAQEGFAALLYDPLDQGERFQDPAFEKPSVHAHVNAGLRAHLLGWGFAQFRIWDGIRAVDYLVSRPDIDRSRIGVAGMSGGGTLTAYLFLHDERLKAACPMAFITDVASLVKGGPGPQDCEQIVFGQMTFGLNHLSFLLGGYPKPVCPGFTYGDFFPFAGSKQTFADAESLYRRFGHGDRIDHLEAPGKHRWLESEKKGLTLWMRRWLCGEEDALPFDRDALMALNDPSLTNSLDDALANLPEGLVLTNGVRGLPGERSVYDILSDEAERLARGVPTREAVRRLLGEPLAVNAALPFDASIRKGYWFRRGGEREQAAAVLALLGRNYLANRVAEIVAEAKAYSASHDGRRMVLKAAGEDVIAAAHAWFLERELFESVEVSNPPPSWSAVLKDPAAAIDLRTTVYGALTVYDWPDLLPKALGGEGNPGEE